MRGRPGRTIPNVASDILTLRLVLRSATLDDLDTLHAVWTDPDVRRYLWDDVVISRDRAREALEDCVATFRARDFGLWLAHHRDGGSLIGFAGLRPFEDDVEVIYGVAPARWRQGYAREMAIAMFGYAFDRIRLPRVLAQTDPPNLGSIAVMRSLGMRRLSDTTRNGHALVRYVIDASDFAGIDSRA